MIRFNFRIIFDQKSKVNKLRKRIEAQKQKEKEYAMLMQQYDISCKTCQNGECLRAGIANSPCFCLDFRK